MGAEIGTFGKVLAQQPVNIFVGAPLPGAWRVAEVDLYARVDLETGVLRHLRALVPGERPTQRSVEIIGQQIASLLDAFAPGEGGRYPKTKHTLPLSCGKV